MYGMPDSLRGVLYRTVHHVTDPGYAQRQTGWRRVRAVAARHAVRDLWPAGAAGVLREPAADGGDVSFDTRGGAGVLGQFGESDQTLRNANLR